MASKINPNTINITYPIAGQDNDTQGFRDNFSNIKNNFSVALSEISALQANSAVSLTTTTVPQSHSDNGTAGQIAYNSNYLYVCVATNTWVRIAVTDTVF
jgi:hypothetical protein